MLLFLYLLVLLLYLMDNKNEKVKIILQILAWEKSKFFLRDTSGETQKDHQIIQNIPYLKLSIPHREPSEECSSLESLFSLISWPSYELKLPTLPPKLSHLKDSSWLNDWLEAHDCKAGMLQNHHICKPHNNHSSPTNLTSFWLADKTSAMYS